MSNATVIKVTCKDIKESLLVRCNLTDAASPVQVDYLVGKGWESTQYQCGNTRHTPKGLAALGEQLLEEALQESDLICTHEIVA